MKGKDVSTPEARYVYAVIPGTSRDEFGHIGIGGARVYVLRYGDIGALVHDCPPAPYQGDTETMMGCVNTHNGVIDRAWAEAGSILPMRFDVIIRPDEGHTADENVRRWLEEEHSNFKIKLDEFRDKVELGVQILWDPAVIASKLAEGSEEIRALRAAMADMSKGTAYLQHHKIAEIVKQELERKAVRDYTACYEALSKHAESIHVNKLKKHDNKTMIANLALLVRREKVEAVGAALGSFSGEEGVEVRFTGPWPPYTFAAKIPVAGERSPVGQGLGNAG
jgi:hypothetical protein